ncbi:MAG: SCP2 sterol-binding domain-containing protein [candidate division Zixibacteria bacterium]
MKSYPKLQDYLNKVDGNITQALTIMSEKMVSVGEPVSIQFAIYHGEIPKYILVHADKGRFGAEKSKVDNPDIEIALEPDTLEKIISGKLAPITAFFTGKLRFRGDEELVLKIVESLR